MLSPSSPVLRCPVPDRVAPVFVQVSTTWLVSLVVFLSHGLQVVTREVHRSSLRRFVCPAQLSFFSHCSDYVYDFCPLPDLHAGPSVLVYDAENTSFHFGLCGRKFVLCLFGQCPGPCIICLSWQHTLVVHLSLQADGRVAFDDIPAVYGVCRPACHDSCPGSFP